jgi:hypothetical protein
MPPPHPQRVAAAPAGAAAAAAAAAAHTWAAAASKSISPPPPLLCSITTAFQFNDAQKKQAADGLRPGLQLDARWEALAEAPSPLKLQPPHGSLTRAPLPLQLRRCALRREKAQSRACRRLLLPCPARRQRAAAGKAAALRWLQLRSVGCSCAPLAAAALHWLPLRDARRCRTSCWTQSCATLPSTTRPPPPSPLTSCARICADTPT